MFRFYSPIGQFPFVSLCFLLTSLLFGCASGDSSPSKEASKLSFFISTTSDVNPDDKLRASPIQIRIYELKDVSSFETADYIALARSDKKTLGDDLLFKDEFILRPGEKREIKRKGNVSTTAIGIVAGYRDIDRSNWKVTYKIDGVHETSWYRVVMPSNKIELNIRLEKKGISLTED
jgi:type VI secretion system protein VasD